MKIYNSKFSLYSLIAILIVAAILRFNHINQPFTDIINWRQASTAMMADNFYRRDWNIFYPEISWDGPGPSYNGREFQTVTYISALLYCLIGQHDWVGRSVAVMFGLWGIFALHQLICRVWSEKHALVSAAIMALLPGSIFIERSFLPDPAMVALVVTSFWFLVAYLQTNRLRYLILASVIGSWGFLSKITGLIAGIPMLYATFTLSGQKPSQLSNRLIQFSIAAVLTLIPVVAYYLWARHLSLSYPPYHFAGSGNWVWDDGVEKWLSQQYFISKALWIFDNWLWTTPIIVLVCLGLFLPPPSAKIHQKHELHALSAENPILDVSSKNIPWLFHWWIIAGIIYYLVGAKELVSNFWNFHILSPAVVALAGHALISIATFASRLMRLPASLAILTAILFTIGGIGQNSLKNMYALSGDYDSTQSYEMGLFLRQISQSDELVVTVANDIGSPIAIYYSQRRGWTFPPARNDIAWNKFLENDNDSIEMFEELRAKGADWFGIVDEHVQTFWEEHPLLANHINSTCEFESKTSSWVVYRILPPEQVQFSN